jgi:uncharacterized protein YbbC (DUF1343 family)
MHKNNKLQLLTAFFIVMSQLIFSQDTLKILEYNTVTTGASQFKSYVPRLAGKRVAILTNVTGKVGNKSIVDTLLKLKVKIKKIFGPEHGFRGNADAGATVENNKDIKTGIPVISLYGSNKKPTRDQLKDIDILIYDIQDIGVRFYTYISTLSYAMEACAENNKQLIVLDRPNPNGFYIDGPVLREEFRSFLGLHPVPLVYGMTCGEYATMVNGEGWLANKAKCKLTVITMKNYNRNVAYKLPEKPSPNIPNINAVLMYPGMGLLEGTIMSLGRGTPFPFQVTGHPEYPDTTFNFTPIPNEISQEPKYVNRRCYGLDLRNDSNITKEPKKIHLDPLKITYTQMRKDDFFDANFNFHAGNRELQEQIKNQVPEGSIRATWKDDIEAFKKIRKKYLLYPDFY